MALNEGQQLRGFDFMKVLRTKQIEDLGGQTRVSEGIAANYMDMLNYSVFGLIQLSSARQADGTPVCQS